MVRFANQTTLLVKSAKFNHATSWYPYSLSPDGHSICQDHPDKVTTLLILPTLALPKSGSIIKVPLYIQMQECIARGLLSTGQRYEIAYLFPVCWSGWSRSLPSTLAVEVMFSVPSVCGVSVCFHSRGWNVAPWNLVGRLVFEVTFMSLNVEVIGQ